MLDKNKEQRLKQDAERQNEIRESLEKKMLASKPGEIVEVTSAELAYTLNFGNMESLMKEVDDIKSGENVRKACLGETSEPELTFEQAARPLIRYLARNYNPHVKVIVDATSAELVEGQIGINTKEYLRG